MQADCTYCVNVVRSVNGRGAMDLFPCDHAIVQKCKQRATASGKGKVEEKGDTYSLVSSLVPRVSPSSPSLGGLHGTFITRATLRVDTRQTQHNCIWACTEGCPQGKYTHR